MEIWKLELTDVRGTTHRIWGSQDILTEAVTEWQAAVLAPDGTGPKLLEIHGFYDTADRTEMLFISVMEDIRQVCLMRLY